MKAGSSASLFLVYFIVAVIGGDIASFIVIVKCIVSCCVDSLLQSELKETYCELEEVQK